MLPYFGIAKLGGWSLWRQMLKIERDKMRPIQIVLSTALLLAYVQAAEAKVNYTSINGDSYCCDSVGPSGFGAQGCTKNPGGNQCAIIRVSKDQVDFNRLGRAVATKGPKVEQQSGK